MVMNWNDSILSHPWISNENTEQKFIYQLCLLPRTHLIVLKTDRWKNETYSLSFLYYISILPYS
jgi:hypothetical protein